MNPLNILLVDDEPEACMNLAHLLNEYVSKNIRILGAVHNTRDAEAAIKAQQPDAIFLDIEMPNENAFQFLERLDTVSFEIVFVTAYDDYAVRAFRLNAVDYVLKPINIDDLKHAVERVEERLRYKNVMNQSPGFYNDLSRQIGQKKAQEHIILKENNHLEVVPFQNVLYVKAMGSYSRIYYRHHNEERTVLMSRPIAEYEQIFPADMFFRTHRSYLVNRTVIKHLSREGQSLTLNNGELLPVGRRRFSELLAFIKSHKH